MADKEAGGRSKRRCVTRKAAVPSAVHYVGYVEDGETPEMIMRKFEELERIMAESNARKGDSSADDQRDQAGTSVTSDAPGTAAAAAAGDAGPSATGGEGETVLGEAELLRVFKQTSIFNVRAALANNEVLMAGDHHLDRNNADSDDLLSEEEEEYNQYMKGFWSDDEFDMLKGGGGGKRGRGGRRGGVGGGQAREPKAPGERRRGGGGGAGGGKNAHAIITQYNRDTNAIIRRKVRVVDKDAMVQIRLPEPPLPLSWGRVVAPWQPLDVLRRSGLGANAAEPAAGASYHETPDLPAFCAQQQAAKQLLPAVAAAAAAAAATAPPSTSSSLPGGGGGGFQGVLINDGWEVDSDDKGEWLSRLAALPLPKLCPVGFVFVWAAKQHVSSLFRLMYAWGYAYVENLTWVKLAPNNSILRTPSPYSCCSHTTLFIFRKDGEGKNIQLLHQRNPDVCFDAVRDAPGRDWDVPAEAYKAIETLLPTGKGSFLELWAARHVRRPGWTHVVEV